MWKQWLIAIVLIVAVTAGAFIYTGLEQGAQEQGGGQAQASAVNVMAPEQRVVRDDIGAVANLRALNAVELTTEVSGRVVEINLEPGAGIAQGAVLLRLDDRQARADLAVIEAQLSDARRQFERAQRLRANNSVSQSQVDELRTSVDVSMAQRQAAQVRLENHRIEAPFAGVVGLSDVSIGAYLQAGTSITTLDTSNQMELSFAVPERFIGQVRLGQAVRATSPAFPGETFEGELIELASRINELSRTLSVRALIDNADGRLRPGQFMSASLTLQEREGLVIPEQAVMIRGDQKYVFVADDGIARRVSVQTGSRMPGMVEIVDGLAVDDQVVVTGQDRLSSGDRVRLLDSDLAIPENRFITSRES
ncbi:efflux RND transporter periplasmic adaptor subunit [Marinobacter halophilus]|uniref:Efflux transporter periplasmic adaptor subunit n=1 Tax=Marinobacter halophilus TaxID=1323740 RepID=A0A2T1KK46_9GAMM|nr:efflux RND transporter periplasmic adaptor subunit [Marinobacter halophilus]PSF09972.1 efflux transporter periplasmic adaptor subunit [Marinobacter halophilus]GGC66633.1 MexH family multidrug efflux RND transporter periplasmic adaptor subunit [Marinobacter halophilus]